jgi:phosphoenolpyruvate carboxykinase (GTP)
MEVIMGVKPLNEIPTKNQKLIKRVEEWAELCKPTGIYWCDGIRAEYDRLMGEMI